MLDHSFAKILPAGVSFGVGCVGVSGENVGGAEVRAEFLGDNGPAHEFRDGEEFQELGFGGSEGIAAIGVDTMKKIGLLVVVG